MDATHAPPNAELEQSLRDSVDALTDANQPPPIVSISHIRGYLAEAKSALLTLHDHPGFEPVVVADDKGRLHWADENYVLRVQR